MNVAIYYFWTYVRRVLYIVMIRVTSAHVNVYIYIYVYIFMICALGVFVCSRIARATTMNIMSIVDMTDSDDKIEDMTYWNMGLYLCSILEHSWKLSKMEISRPTICFHGPAQRLSTILRSHNSKDQPNLDLIGYLMLLTKEQILG